VEWIAFAVLSVTACFAILFTGRRPRAVFDFNVGDVRVRSESARPAFVGIGPADAVAACLRGALLGFSLGLAGLGVVLLAARGVLLVFAVRGRRAGR
jgi:hypothetical protein